MRTKVNYLILVLFPLFFNCKDFNNQDELNDYVGYALLEYYPVNDGYYNYNVFPINSNSYLENANKIEFNYGLILKSDSYYQSHLKVIQELSSLDYNYRDGYVLVKIDYDLLNTNWNESTKEWDDSIEIGGISKKIKLYFPQKKDIVRINDIEFIKIVR